MASLNIQQLRSDKRYKEHVLWHDWMTAAADLASRFYDDVDKDDPFAYNETASVGFLATAAAKAGYLALPEFAIEKIDQKDRRKRRGGRSDLWIQAASDQEWLFEFKHIHISRGSARDLERKWDGATSCAKAVKKHGTCVAGLIVSFTWLKSNCPEHFDAAHQVLISFLGDKQFAWRIAGDEIVPETYLCFKIIKDN